jgi:HD-GYP domain-containing protein (c-di-GMP phosphodiesterase class II)
LIAKDRPYKKPMNLSKVMKIMELMKKNKHIDQDIYDLFVKSGIYYQHAKKEMDPDLIDQHARSDNNTDKLSETARFPNAICEPSGLIRPGFSLAHFKL